VHRRLAGPDHEITPNAIEVHGSETAPKRGDSVCHRACAPWISLGRRPMRRDLLDHRRVDTLAGRFPLMLLALCGPLVHYSPQLAPGVISSDRPVEGPAANARDGHLTINTVVCWSTPVRTRHPAAVPDSVIYTMLYTSVRLIDCDSRLPALPMSG